MASKTKTKQPLKTDERLYKALSHPLRFKILVKLNERAASPSDLAVELGEKVGNVAYHVRTLLDLETIELVGTEQVRGTLEHFYRATQRPFVDDDHWAALPPSIREQFGDTILQGLWEHVVEAADNGAFADPDPHVSWTSLDLDKEGHEAVARILVETIDRVLAEHAASAGREASRSPEESESQRTELAMMHYRRPRPDEGD
jgi:DNA-binding transcriptional ArsR family regulator